MKKAANQHYVWQKYLEPWTVNGKILCLREQSKIICTNTRNVASQRYFYRIDKLTLNDCKIIRKAFIEKESSSYMQQLLLGWVRPIELLIQLRPYSIQLDSSGELNEEIESLQRNALEELYTGIEKSALSTLGYLLSQSEKEILIPDMISDDKFVDFVLYLCFQYFRTKRMKEAIIKNIGRAGELFSDVGETFNVIAIILATKIGFSIYNSLCKGEYYCCLISNRTDLPFITGDQPIINVYANENPQIETTDLELYYPVSPTRALLISKEHSENINCSVEEAKEYNDLIAKQSLELLFALHESELRAYLI